MLSQKAPERPLPLGQQVGSGRLSGRASAGGTDPLLGSHASEAPIIAPGARLLRLRLRPFPLTILQRAGTRRACSMRCSSGTSPATAGGPRRTRSRRRPPLRPSPSLRQERDQSINAPMAEFFASLGTTTVPCGVDGGVVAEGSRPNGNASPVAAAATTGRDLPCEAPRLWAATWAFWR